MSQHHLFLSYARADNGPDNNGWVTAFHDRLLAQHALYSGRKLDIFFDKTAIQEGQDWKNRIYENLRSSKLFVAFLSPAYLRSEWCKREWEAYLRLEHSLARKASPSRAGWRRIIRAAPWLRGTCRCRWCGWDRSEDRRWTGRRRLRLLPRRSRSWMGS